MNLIVHRISLEMITAVKPVIDSIARHDRDLANQVRRAAASVPLNIGEGAYSRGGNQITRFHSAAGSAAETRSALQVAAAWGYADRKVCDKVDSLLDRILAMLWRLTHPR